MTDMIEGEEPGPSLYNFDLTSPEGVDQLIALLPILDEEIIKSVYQECFPGYPSDNIAVRIARTELRGFFMDFLDGTLSANPSQEPDAGEAPQEPGEAQPAEGSADAGSSDQTGSEASATGADEQGTAEAQGQGAENQGRSPENGNEA